MGVSRRVEIHGPAGRLEGILQEGGGPEPSRLAVVCHPHPLGGGTMNTKVVHRAARALAAAGHAVLRFNFRGAGASEGTHDQGIGERGDVRAALDHLCGLHTALPVTAAGFSFGSWVGLHVGAADPRVGALIALAPPVNLYDYGFLASCPKPKLFVHGTADALAPLAALEEFYPAIAAPKTLVRIEGATHLMTERLDDVEEAVRRFALTLSA